jgi:hypothetical protein
MSRGERRLRSPGERGQRANSFGGLERLGCRDHLRIEKELETGCLVCYKVCEHWAKLSAPQEILNHACLTSV